MSTNSQKKLYSQDGVDVEEEASFSAFAGSICKESYQNSPFVEVHDLSGGNFRGPRPFTFKNLPEGFFIETSTDSIGTKGIITDAAKTHHLAGYDLIAMNASDITRFGGVPVAIVNVLDTTTVGEEESEERRAYEKAIVGLAKAAKESKMVILKGETAQMTEALGSEIKNSKTKINWAGAVIGVYHKDKIVTGDTLAPGQVIIALKENGFRCNGISSVRRALKEKFGENWWDKEEAKESIRMAAEPSVLYDTFVSTLHGWFNKDWKPEIKLHAIVHLSGGAIKEKLAKDILFRRGLSAEILDLWEPPTIMINCAKWRGIEDEEFYEVWNGGQGMFLIVDEKDKDYCIKRAKEFNIEAKVAGKITKENSPQILIMSKLTPNKKIIWT